VGAAAVPAAVALAAPTDAVALSRPVLDEVTFTLPDLHPAHDGLRVVQLSDIHVGWLTPREYIRFAIDAANAFNPDLVVLTGDYLCFSRSGVDLMKEQMGGLHAPTVAVLGNHDWWSDADGAIRVLNGHGYAVLRNDHVSIPLRGEPFTVIGVDDERTNHADPARAFAFAPKVSRLVLAHTPRTARYAVDNKEPVLVLAGHTHGGQIKLPGVTWVIVHGFMHEQWFRGYYKVGQTQIYVNRGLGNSGIPLRVDAPPEVTLMTLRSGLVKT
jgi:hypothetical protein